VRALLTVNVRRLAADYSQAVRTALTPLQLAMVRSGERTEHDYLDANDLIHAALTLQSPGADMVDHDTAINAAVDRAARSGFELRRVLVACEFSGIVRDAFAARGHDAISADLLETEQPGPHYIGDARDIMSDGYHTLIAHPPCTYMCNSSRKHMMKDGKRINPERWEKFYDAAQLFQDFATADIAERCVENPIPHTEARAIIGRPTQYVHPYQFGEDKSKKTGLWLHDLPPLVDSEADHVAPRIIQYQGKPAKRWANQSPCGADNTPESPERWRTRSRFFHGIADAMSSQWGIA
jgi:hypothetical protein